MAVQIANALAKGAAWGSDLTLMTGPTKMQRILHFSHYLAGASELFPFQREPRTFFIKSR
jgi:hypothetical protein